MSVDCDHFIVKVNLSKSTTYFQNNFELKFQINSIHYYRNYLDIDFIIFSNLNHFESNFALYYKKHLSSNAINIIMSVRIN
jgi:hypothetical protein